MKTVFPFFVFAFFISLVFIQCKSDPNTEVSEKTEVSKLGIVNLKVSGAPEAQAAFEKGLLLLHSFEYEDSKEAFLEAQAIDSNFVMAYWGEALSYNHPLWRQQDTEKALTALNKLAASSEERIARAQSEIEKQFMQGIEILYGSGEKKERDKAYSSHLEEMYQQFPDNSEVAAFYALSILGAVDVGRDKEMFEKGANIAKGVISENPNHPGALHYLIHSYDDPEKAPMALNAANSYSKVAPDAAHALHMPSHIYVAMGMWDEVISANIASFDASVNRMERKELETGASYHALHWLMYGLLQKGKFEQAAQKLSDMRAYVEAGDDSKRARDYLMSMKGNYLMESDDWDSDLADINTDISDLNINVKAISYFLDAWKAYRDQDVETVKEIISMMETSRKEASNFVSLGAPAMCSAATSRYLPNQLDIDEAHILELEVKALAAMLLNNKVDTEKWLQAAVELETNTSYAYGPPPIVKPSYELYGDWLLEQGRMEEAATQFDYAIAKGPNRLLALWGKLKTIEKTDQTLAEELRTELSSLLEEGDPEVKTKILPKRALSEI